MCNLPDKKQTEETPVKDKDNLELDLENRSELIDKQIHKIDFGKYKKLNN
jgi:hypothetical protein